jgi:glycosyltransferase involved in cell wall biosynthesis
VFSDNEPLVKAFNGCGIQSRVRCASISNIYEYADGIIPVVPYVYEVPYYGMQNLRKCILLPINANEIQYKPNIVKNKKIIFFHGVSRRLDKGSAQIIEAMHTIEKRYPQTVKCISAERLPYDEYVELLAKTNVVIDQCKSYGYGVNGCISMAMGKVLLSGAEPEVIQRGNLFDCPVINITPEVNQIVNQMERVIENYDQIEYMGVKGREYVEKHHNYIDIARQYLREWER